MPIVGENSLHAQNGVVASRSELTMNSMVEHLVNHQIPIVGEKLVATCKPRLLRWMQRKDGKAGDEMK